MADITRADLWVFVKADNEYVERKVTDEEFDLLARKAGYFHDQDVGATVRRQSALIWIADNPGKALRALLTDKCDCEDGLVEVQCSHIASCDCIPDDVPHGVCGGRGWVPKDGVTITDGCTLQGEPHSFGQCKPEYRLSVSIDWLEAEDE